MNQETSLPLLPTELGHLGTDELLVNETFLSIQGESTYAGRVCFFIRLAGCHLRCSWCDTEHAFYEGTRRSVSELVTDAQRAGSPLVEVTGGEPLLQKATPILLQSLVEAGLETLLETSGALGLEKVPIGVRKIVDWKCPASRMAHANHPLVPYQLRSGDELKLVIEDRHDYEWARDWLTSIRSERPEIGGLVPVHFSPVHGRLQPAQLAAWILEDRLGVRVQLQLHKFLWSASKRGV